MTPTERTLDLDTGEETARPITADNLKTLRVVEYADQPVRNADWVAGNLQVGIDARGNLKKPRSVPLRKGKAASTRKPRKSRTEADPFLTRKELRRLKRGAF